VAFREHNRNQRVLQQPDVAPSLPRPGGSADTTMSYDAGTEDEDMTPDDQAVKAVLNSAPVAFETDECVLTRSNEKVSENEDSSVSEEVDKTYGVLTRACNQANVFSWKIQPGKESPKRHFDTHGDEVEDVTNFANQKE